MVSQENPWSGLNVTAAVTVQHPIEKKNIFVSIYVHKTYFFPPWSNEETFWGLQNLDGMDKKNIKTINTDNNNVTTLQLHVMGNKDIDLIEGKQDVKSSTGMTPNAIFIYIF